MQTSGEFEEKFAARGLHLMTNCPPHPLFIMADGRRLWRIIENLYRNVEKYAMPQEEFKDMTYIFYCSKTGTVLYPLALHHKNIDLDLYFKLVKSIDLDFL